MAYKLSMIFQYLSGDGSGGDLNLKGGWSESVYNGVFAPATLTSLKALAAARANLLPLRSYVSGLRVQQVDPSGPAQTFSLNYPGGGTSGATLSDIPQMALLLRVRGTGVTNVRSMRVAAIPDSQITLGEYKPSSPYTLAMAAYLAELDGWQFRATSLTAVPSNLASIAADGTYVLQQDLVIAVGSKVKVKNVQDEDGEIVRGGVFTVGVYTDSKHGKLNSWTGGAVTLGQMIPFTIIYPVIITDGQTISRAVVRKIGRPSLGYRGRRSKRRV